MKYCEKSQRGVALLLSLGVLTLLLVMALAYVTNAVIARKAAANNSNRSLARYFAKSAAAKVLTDVMYMQISYGDTVDFSGIVSRNDAGGGGDSDMLNLVTATSPATATPGLLDYYIAPTGWVKFIKEPRWVLVKDDSSPTPKIIGRYAYRLLPQSGQVNLSGALLGYKDQGDTITNPGGTANWNNRFGAGLRELDLRAMQEFALNSNHLGAVVPSGGFSDYTTMFAAMPDLTEAEQAIVRRHFVANGEEKEVYFYDQGNTGKRELMTRYHRFNLGERKVKHPADTGVVCDFENGLGTTVNSTAAVDRLLGVESGLNAEYASGDTVSPGAMPLQFLRMIGADGGASGSSESRSLATRRKQIAANLLDYCDSDNISTSDKPVWTLTGGLAGMPTFTGNERVPYINQVGAGVMASVIRSDYSVGTTEEPASKFKFTVTPSHKSILADLISLYDTANDALPMIENTHLNIGRITVTFRVSAYDGNGAPIELNQSTATMTINDTPAAYRIGDLAAAVRGVGVGGAHYYGFNLAVDEPKTPAIFEGTATYRPAVDVNYDNCRIEVAVTGLSVEGMFTRGGSGENYDFVRTLATNSANAKVFEKALADAGFGSGSAIVGFAVDDPRDNLYQGDNWKFVNSKHYPEADPSDYDTLQTEPVDDGTFFFNRKNSVCNPGASGDAEAVDPENVSTMHIRNSWMRSPLELGFIHRAGKWETIRLDKATDAVSHAQHYDPAADLTAAGTAYADGDGGILDQIKFEDAALSPCKVDLTGRDAVMLSALFCNVGYKSFASFDDMLGASDITATIAKTIGEEAADKLPDTMANRAEALYLNYGTGFGKVTPEANKRSRDSLAAKTLCLTTTVVNPPTVIQVVAAAQSIRDVGGGIAMTKRDSDGDNINGTVATGTFDFNWNNGDPVYFDEITGEVKMLLTIQRDAATRKLRVERMEFID